MKKLPKVAILGKPNAGKSSLFNRLVGKRKAIVEETSGITRDRVHGEVSFAGKEFSLIDTGGLEFSSEKSLGKQIVRQAEKAVRESDLLLLMVDFQTGLTNLDKDISNYLRKFGKPLFLVVNKVDNMENIDQGAEFYELGIEKVYFISAGHGLNIDELLDAVIEELKPGREHSGDAEPELRVAIIGRPNAGKSSFVNKLLKEERVIVDGTAGTTRDAIDTHLHFYNRKLVLIDTAGICHKKKIKESIDVFSRSRTVSAVKSADVCIVLLDAQKGITRDDLHIFELVTEERKCCVICVNKADLVKLSLKVCVYTISERAPLMRFAFCNLCSAKTGHNVFLGLKLAISAWDNSHLKIKQKQLSRIQAQLPLNNPQLNCRGKLKLHYLTQIKINPPMFLLIVNRPELVKKQFLRYIENTLRSEFNFHGSPINLAVKKKERT